MTQMLRVAVLDSKYLGDAALFQREKAAVDAFGGQISLLDLKTEEDIISRASDFDALLCCGNPPITRQVLKSFQGMAVIRYGIGVNSVDIQAAVEYGKLVYNSPGFCAEELVMHASALILASLRNIGYYNQRVKAGEWPKGKGPIPRRLSGLTVGLFGFGASAQPLADVFAQGFHSRVIACDPCITRRVAEEKGVELVDFERLLRESDVISVHAPLLPSTRHIFDRAAFRKMKSNALLVNVARGGLVCESDLIEALRTGEIGGAALDVLETEPILPDNPLKDMDNVIITPHSGFYGLEAIETGHEIAAMLITQLAKKRIVRKNLVNPDVLDRFDDYTVV